MADVICRVCGEPWEVYHLRHDAPAWVMPLVLSGAGCESCEGVAPEGADTDAIAEESDRSFVIDGAIDTDPLTERPAIAGDAPPKWERPQDPIAWQCASCTVHVARDLDWREGSNFAYQVRGVGSYYQQRDLGVDRDDQFASLSDAIDTISIDGAHCRRCAYKCRDCDRVIVEGEDFSAAPPDDPYHSKDSLCEECFSSAEYECAVESYSQRDLIESLGYDDRVSGPGAWLDNRTISFGLADSLGLVEIEGDHVRYLPPIIGHGIASLDRDKKARILRALRKELRES